MSGSTCKFEEISWKIINLRANDLGVKPNGASAWILGTDCDSLHTVYILYRGTCGQSYKITISRKLGQSFNIIKKPAKFLEKKDICQSLVTFGVVFL